MPFIPGCTVSSCKLDVKHLVNKIDVDAAMMVYNYSKHQADTLIFSLNSGLIARQCADKQQNRFGSKGIGRSSG